MSRLYRILSAFAFGLLIVTGAFLIVLLGMAMREEARA